MESSSSFLRSQVVTNPAHKTPVPASKLPTQVGADSAMEFTPYKEDIFVQTPNSQPLPMVSKRTFSVEDLKKIKDSMQPSTLAGLKNAAFSDHFPYYVDETGAA